MTVLVVRMIIFMCDNIGCLNEWVVSGGGVNVVEGLVDGCDVVFDVMCFVVFSFKDSIAVFSL